MEYLLCINDVLIVIFYWFLFSGGDVFVLYFEGIEI